MGILLGIKKYLYAAVGLATTIFLGWVYFLKKDNEAKEEKIEDMEYEAKVVEAVHEEEQKVAEFKGTVDTSIVDLKKAKEKANVEYIKAKEKSNDEAGFNGDGYTFT